MPKFLEDKLASGAKKKGLSGKRAKAYIYGTMNNMGAMKGNKITKKGKAMEKKHNSDMKRRMSSARKKRTLLKR